MIKSAATKVRNFEVKGLNFDLTVTRLKELTVSPTAMTCKTEDRGIGNALSCLIKLGEQVCRNIPAANGYAFRQCAMTYPNVSPAMVPLSTIAGLNVSEINIKFFEGKAIRIDFKLNPEREFAYAGDAFKLKYGPPEVENRQGATWHGLDEKLEVGNHFVVLSKPSAEQVIAKRVQQIQIDEASKAQDATKKARTKALSDV